MILGKIISYVINIIGEIILEILKILISVSKENVYFGFCWKVF